MIGFLWQRMHHCVPQSGLIEVDTPLELTESFPPCHSTLHTFYCLWTLCRVTAFWPATTWTIASHAHTHHSRKMCSYLPASASNSILTHAQQWNEFWLQQTGLCWNWLTQPVALKAPRSRKLESTRAKYASCFSLSVKNVKRSCTV